MQIANAGFLELAQLERELQAIGQSLDNWVGDAGDELSALLARVRSDEAVPLMHATLHGARGGAAAIELSAVRIPDRDEEVFGFIIRTRHDGEAAPRLDGLRPAGSVH